MLKKVHYVYLTPFLKETVTDSQVVNWLELLQQENIVFDLFMFTSLMSYFRSRKEDKIKIGEARQKLLGAVRHTYIPPSISGQIIVFLILLFIVLKNTLSNKKIVIQTRTSAYFLGLKWLKTISPNINIIFDVRGASAEEILLEDPNNKALYAKSLKKEVDFINLADKIFCVSDQLMQYYSEKCPTLHPDKSFVIPGCADQTTFYYNNTARKEIRKNLEITDKFVFVYSGRLDKPWQIPDFIFSTFARLLNLYPNLFLMCLTPNKSIAEELTRKYNISSNAVWVDYIKYTAISNYLSAADAGLLFRENNPTNNVASPTKFAEYLLTGLPVIISEGIGDFSNFVRQQQIGVVVDNISDGLIAEIETNLISKQFDRKAIAELGKRHFSKETHLHTLVTLYKKLHSLC